MAKCGVSCTDSVPRIAESDEDLRKIMNNFNKDKEELEGRIEEKKAELERVEANHRAVRTRHGKEGQKLGELNANRKVGFHASFDVTILTHIAIAIRPQRN
jgi:predicted nuclease with TOPRIM domain